MAAILIVLAAVILGHGRLAHADPRSYGSLSLAERFAPEKGHPKRPGATG